MKKFRILALDGGGTWALIQARALARIYGKDTPGREILGHFRLAAASAGGSIVLACLCADYTPRQIFELFERPDVRRLIFRLRRASGRSGTRNVSSRYSTKQKRAALEFAMDLHLKPGEPALSGIRLQDVPKLIGVDIELLISAFDFNHERTAFFRSDTDSHVKSSGQPLNPTLVDAVHASTNASVRYFDEPAEIDVGHAGKCHYWDGTMTGNNNPVLAAVMEALTNHETAIDDIRVLSIGAATVRCPMVSEGEDLPLGVPEAGTCCAACLGEAAAIVLADSPDVASFHAHMALHQPVPIPGQTVAGHIVRMNPVIGPRWDNATGTWMLPTPKIRLSEFDKLVGMDMDATDQDDVDLIRKLCDCWIDGEVQNQPIRAGGCLRGEIGHSTFDAALDHWERISQ